MTFTDIKKQLKEGTTSKFYVFSGEEWKVQQIYINHIAEHNKQVVKRIDRVAEAIKSKGSLLNQPVCYVCCEDTEFQKAENESAWSSIADMLGENTLIYQVLNIDKRSKFYSHFEQQIVLFEHMTDQVLTKHIRECVGLSTSCCKELIRICESDYGRVLSELDKIKHYQGYLKDDTKADLAFETLVTDGTIYQPPIDAIFDWVDALLSGQVTKSFELLQECLDIGEPSLRLLLVLYQGIKRLLQVQSCPAKDIANNTGLNQWEINLVSKHRGVYSNRELVCALQGIQALELAIKQGRIDEEYAVPYAMVCLLKED